MPQQVFKSLIRLTDPDRYCSSRHISPEPGLAIGDRDVHLASLRLHAGVIGNVGTDSGGLDHRGCFVSSS